MKFTLLLAALSLAAQVSLAQVVISDGGTQTADANALLGREYRPNYRVPEKV